MLCSRIFIAICRTKIPLLWRVSTSNKLTTEAMEFRLRSAFNGTLAFHSRNTGFQSSKTWAEVEVLEIDNL